MPATSRKPRLVALLLVLVLIVAACGGSSNKGNNAGSGSSGSSTAGTAQPVAGGKVVYALGAETPGGFCLPESQLAIEGEQVVRAVYDSLVVPGEDNSYKPFLAKSVTHNTDYTEWTITLRDGILFTDGSKLDATVVKNNLDAFRNAYVAADGSKPRSALLLSFVFANVKDTAVVDPLTVKVTSKTPWVDFDAYLWWEGRVAIIGQAQLDNPTSCDKKLIGTGPFMVKGGTITNTQDIDLVKNPNYWRKDANGVQLPYLDELEIRSIPDETQRLSALQSGDINMAITDSGQSIAELRGLRDQGKVTTLESPQYAEVSYYLLNSSAPPFNNQAAREAVAYGFDRDTYNQVQSAGVRTNADGPFAPDNLGFVADTGFPHFDKQKAIEKAAQYKSETGRDLSFTMTTVNDPMTIAGAQLFQQMMNDVGIPVQLAQTDQPSEILQAIAGQVQLFEWRNHPGGDPDTQYDWWHSGSTINFGKINDPEVDRLLDDGRTNPDPAARKKDYEDLNRLLGSKVYNVWTTYSLWTIATAPNVHGILGPDLPDGGGKPWPALVNGTSVAGLFITK